ncbi:uncharacterized protein LOC129611534 [Condylostylus longicornis]|uniref:uncharacterized protein LOC129611534 n=1 Tax=Condylostylus longicornis TaxID=2530218 RepID=UPI00244DAB7C|nr:uncharacterized protein LOC129611534 [Condylostylus longicornis]
MKAAKTSKRWAYIGVLNNDNFTYFAAQKAGLEVVSTVCDGGTTNIKAIRTLKENSRIRAMNLGKEFRSCGFEINGKIVNPIIDPPHLIKLIRNHFIEKNLIYKNEDITVTAKWDHIKNFYEIDSGVSVLRMTKLTEQHVFQHCLKKMKVSHCVKVLSATVGKLMLYTIEIGKKVNEHAHVLGEGAGDTAAAIMFLDRLFDSMNGSSSNPPRCKELRGPFGEVQKYFWENEAKPILCSMNVNPNSKQFTCNYKTLLINNMTSAHSVGSNCMNDENISLIQNLKNFIKAEKTETTNINGDEQVQSPQTFQTTSKEKVIVAAPSRKRGDVILQFNGILRTANDFEDFHIISVNNNFTMINDRNNIIYRYNKQ